jgi:threonine dehydrogenase-like Zn-dependent dehydrogenase
MRAVVLEYAGRRLGLREVAEPQSLSRSQVLLRIHEVGVCGTDRELALFQLGFPPPAEDYLVIGHEALGQVVDTGPEVRKLQRGDWVVPMIRRACRPACAACARGRRDLCVSPGMRERGIFGLHGYFAEYAVDDEDDLVPVPPSLADRAILIEPLSVVEKAVAMALRAHEPGAGSALVLGAGPIGILAALALQIRGLEVAVHSLEPPDHPRAALLREAGFEYLPELGVRRADIVIEATGSAASALAGIGQLAPLGVCVILGANDGAGQFPFRQLITGNQCVLGSVNASPEAFAAAQEDLARFDRGIVEGLIRRLPFSNFEESILGPPALSPKLVHVVAE